MMKFCLILFALLLGLASFSGCGGTPGDSSSSGAAGGVSGSGQ